MAPNSDSRLFLASRLDITALVVVIDLAAIDGLSVDQIAAYAAMRVLARTRPARSGSASPRPAGLTRFDFAYLRSLYEAGSNVPAAVKIGGIARTLRKEMTPPPLHPPQK